MSKRRPWGSAQRKNGRWWAVYSPHKGSRRRVWEKVAPDTRTRALDVLAQRRAELAAGSWDDPTRILTFAALADEWFATMAPSWRPQTKSLYRTRLHLHLLPRLGDMDVRAIDGPVLQRVVSSLSLSPSTMRIVLGIARQILRWGHRHGRLRVLRDMTVTLPAAERARVDPLTREEVPRLLHHAFEWRPLLMWAVYTGMRQGEILAAKWRHLDLERGVYYVRESLNREGEIASTKTNDGGSCWVPEGLLRTLDDQRAQVATWELAAKDWEDNGLIFPGRRGRPCSHTTLIQAFRRACDGAGLRRRPFHHLRHTCASLLVDQGETILTVAAQLRHRDPGLTLRVYSHLMPDAGAAALRRLDEALGP